MSDNTKHLAKKYVKDAGPCLALCLAGAAGALHNLAINAVDDGVIHLRNGRPRSVAEPQHVLVPKVRIAGKPDHGELLTLRGI